MPPPILSSFNKQHNMGILVRDDTKTFLVNMGMFPLILLQDSDVEIVSMCHILILFDNNEMNVIGRINSKLFDTISELNNIKKIDANNNCLIVSFSEGVMFANPINGSYKILRTKDKYKSICYDNKCLIIFSDHVYHSTINNGKVNNFERIELIPKPDNLQSVYYLDGYIYYTYNGCPCRFRSDQILNNSIVFEFYSTNLNILDNLPSRFGNYYSLLIIDNKSKRKMVLVDGNANIIVDGYNQLAMSNQVIYCIFDNKVHYVDRKPIRCAIPKSNKYEFVI